MYVCARQYLAQNVWIVDTSDASTSEELGYKLVTTPRLHLQYIANNMTQKGGAKSFKNLGYLLHRSRLV